MSKYELTNGRAVKANGNKRFVEGTEKLIKIAIKTGYKNIRSEIGSAGNTIWIGDLNEYIKDGMFAIAR